MPALALPMHFELCWKHAKIHIALPVQPVPLHASSHHSRCENMSGKGKEPKSSQAVRRSPHMLDMNVLQPAA